METAIKVTNLSKKYKGKKGLVVEALKNLNLEISKGETFGFLGPNGAGKTTTIKILMSLIFPTSGSFNIFNQKSNSLEYKKNIGFIPENPSFYDYLSGEEIMQFVGRAFKMSEIEIKKGAEKYLKLLELWEDRKRVIRTYSKGMIQRLGFAQALMHNPEIYILDEPMSGLDPLGRILVRDLILDLKKEGKTIFMSTHILNDVENICDRVGIIVKGELRAIESLQNVMRSGVKNYLVSFNKISNEILNFIVNTSERVNENSFKVKSSDIELVMSKIHQDKETSLQMIEPVRKGLEELFVEIINAG